MPDALNDGSEHIPDSLGPELSGPALDFIDLVLGRKVGFEVHRSWLCIEWLWIEQVTLHISLPTDGCTRQISKPAMQKMHGLRAHQKARRVRGAPGEILAGRTGR
ncbi:MAG: hypothetical protein AB3N21_06060 [Ruegeria sp.]|uniref:hypothetical protein n=1 Tax=Ruegeria sp. TaxID=1879320 RepID=UPI00349EBD54